MQPADREPCYTYYMQPQVILDLHHRSYTNMAEITEILNAYYGFKAYINYPRVGAKMSEID
jgi:hypothetical protein